MDEKITSRWNKLVIVQILGDAEAFFFDWTKLGDEQKTSLVATHLAAFDENMRARKKEKWSDDVVPFALLGKSMPKEVRGAVDLSAEHEGTLLWHKEKEAIAYISASDDLRAYYGFDSVDAFKVTDSFREEPFDIEKMDFAGDPTKRTGFTFDEMKTHHGPIVLMIGKSGGLFGFFERVKSLWGGQ